MDLAGKAALITGGGTGVGRATALELAQQGCNVLVNYSRSADDAATTAKDAEAFGVKAIAHQADVSDDAQCRSMVETATDAFGRLDILVNNAGTTTFVGHRDLEGLSDADWDNILGVNLKGPFFMARAAKQALDATGEGVIVNVSSIAGVRGVGSSIPYCASKAGLINLTLTLARAMAPKIRVNCVAPGFITGRWLQSGFADKYDTIKETNEKRSPLGKVCDPEDVADGIMTFITGSKLVTGETMVIDGGMLIGRGLG
jgi:3-oxoacyl-[acyl-carrier protein] reductase